jgi:hypothetical protein
MAAIIAAAVAGTATIASSAMSANAAGNAAGASKKAQRDTLAEQRRQYDLTRADQEPWRKAGTAALGRLENPMASFQTSPDYQFRKESGLEGIAQSKAIGGLLKSGSALTDSIGFNSNLAAGEYSDWFNRQLAQAGLGQAANSANQQAGQFYASAVGQANQANALAQMQSAYQQGNAWAQGIGQVGGIFANALANYGRPNNQNQGTTSAINRAFGGY